MGLRFRKSFNLGPAKYTVSPSGVSKSLGVKGYRRTKTASGAVRSTASIPGTGISYSTQSGRGRGSGKKPGKWKTALIVIAVLLVLGWIFGAEDKAEAPAPTENVTRAEAITADKTPAETAELRLIEKSADSTPSPTPRVNTYVLNTSSGVFHRPGCSAAKKMSDANRAEIEATRDDMLAKGYSACGICNP